MEFQYYIGGIKSVTPKGKLSLKQFLNKTKNPKKETTVLLKAIEVASGLGDKIAKNKLKEKLPYFTPSVIVKDGKARRYENIESFTGLAQLDFDGFDNVDTAIDMKNWLFNEYPQIICAYLSPSNKGVKALIKIPICKNVDEFQDYYRAISKHFKNDLSINQFDVAPQNAILPLFYSEDKNLLQRSDAIDWIDKIEKEIFVPIERQTLELKDKQMAGFVRKFFERIDLINDNGHPQFRSACLMLGSLTPHYISESEALTYCEQAIRTNSYLSNAHNFSTYFNTAKWCIKNSNPYYV